MEQRLVMAKLIWNFDVDLTLESEGWLEGQKAYFLWKKPALMVKLTPVKRNAE